MTTKEEKATYQVLQVRQVISNGATLGGKPLVEGTRVSIPQIGEDHAKFGWSPEKIQEAYGLELAVVFAALSYYYDHKEEMDALWKTANQVGEDIPHLTELL